MAIWYDFNEWEDFINGMYDTRIDEEKILQCYNLFLDDNLFYKMLEMVRKWRKSSAVNLSKTIFNRKAWVGQATCSYHLQATSSETVKAWFMLNKDERDKANLIANQVIEVWEDENI
jgi:hypothetical protein